MASLPYVTAHGNIERALKGIQTAATPERVTQDFVKTILKIPGGSGDQMTAFLRKIGFVNSDGTPSDLYKKFRNSSSAGSAALDALRFGYASLYKRNEFMHQMSDKDLRGLIIEETGQGDESTVVGLIHNAIKSIKKFTSAASVEPVKKAQTEVIDKERPILPSPPGNGAQKLGLNLSYTINLDLRQHQTSLSLMQSLRA